MKKQLPMIKKSLKSFILDEDAKIIDKTAIKIALSASLLITTFSIENVQAGGGSHKNHSNHSNAVRAGIDDTVSIDGEEINFDIEQAAYYKATGESEATIPGKSAAAVHANHYNKVDSEDGSS